VTGVDVSSAPINTDTTDPSATDPSNLGNPVVVHSDTLGDLDVDQVIDDWTGVDPPQVPAEVSSVESATLEGDYIADDLADGIYVGFLMNALDENEQGFVFDIRNSLADAKQVTNGMHLYSAYLDSVLFVSLATSGEANSAISVSKYFELDHLIGINDYTYSDLFHGLTLLLSNFNETYANTYLNIIEEELSYNLKNKLGCPKSKLDILLINLVPFINYKFNISSEWVLSMEIKYIILKLINIKNIKIKNELVDIIWDTYIKSNIVSKDFIGTLISQWIIKIKV
jgi:hypothetical protein